MGPPGTGSPRVTHTDEFLGGTMSDVSSGAGPGGAIRNVDLPPEPAETAYPGTGDPTVRTETYGEPAGASDASAGDKARQVAYEGRQAAAQATGEVTGTA